VRHFPDVFSQFFRRPKNSRCTNSFHNFTCNLRDHALRHWHCAPVPTSPSRVDRAQDCCVGRPPACQLVGPISRPICRTTLPERAGPQALKVPPTNVALSIRSLGRTGPISKNGADCGADYGARLKQEVDRLSGGRPSRPSTGPAPLLALGRAVQRGSPGQVLPPGRARLGEARRCRRVVGFARRTGVSDFSGGSHFMLLTGFGPTISKIFGHMSSFPFLVMHTLMRCGGGPCLHEWESSPSIIWLQRT
jgi:hypothetical protein